MGSNGANIAQIRVTTGPESRKQNQHEFWSSTDLKAHEFWSPQPPHLLFFPVAGHSGAGERPRHRLLLRRSHPSHRRALTTPVSRPTPANPRPSSSTAVGPNHRPQRHRIHLRRALRPLAPATVDCPDAGDSPRRPPHGSPSHTALPRGRPSSSPAAASACRLRLPLRLPPSPPATAGDRLRPPSHRRSLLRRRGWATDDRGRGFWELIKEENNQRS